MTRPTKIAILLFGIITLFVLGGILITSGIKAITAFFGKNTIISYKMIEVKYHKPWEIITLEEQNRRKAESEMIDAVSTRVTDEIMNPEKYQDKCKSGVVISPSVFFETIRQNETTNGKVSKDPTALHMYCRAKGLWNEIGYNPQNKFCFKDRTEAELYVAYYIKKNCDGMTQNQCLCLWNTGKVTDTCAYARGELSLAD